MKWKDIALASVQELQAAPPGGSLSLADELMVLRRCKGLLDSFSFSGYIMPGFETHTLDISGTGKQVYTVGPSKDVPSSMIPHRLHMVTYKPGGWLDYRAMTEVDIRGYVMRNSSVGTFPWAYYYEVDSGTEGKLYLNATPTSGDSFKLRWHPYLLPSGDLDPEADPDFPVGYDRFIWLSLAEDLANTYNADTLTRRDLKMKLKPLRQKILMANRPVPDHRVENMFVAPGRESRWPHYGYN